MNFDRLRTFRVLADTLHFRKAAEKLHLSQPAVSQQIAALEAELGVALFERIGRRVFLTPAGRVLAEEGTRVLAAVARAREAVTALGKGDAGELRVGASTTPGIYLLPAVLGRFRAALPGVRVTLRIANSEAIEAALVANELDIAVVGGHTAHQELFEVDLGEDEIVCVGAPSLLGRARRVMPRDLARWPFLEREVGSATRRAVEEALAEHGVKLPAAYDLPTPEALVHAAVAGLGVTFASRHAVAAELAARHLAVLRVDGVSITRPLVAAYHRDKRVTPAMKKLVGLLGQQRR